MSLWFVSAAILPEIVAEGGLGPGRAAALSSAVQIGFVLGALALAVHGTADRYDPRRVILVSALIAAAANLALLVTPLGGVGQVGLRALTGAGLAGVYPVGMKVLVGWGTRDRGALVGLFVGALTVGSALPHLLAFFGGPDWRATVVATSALAVLGGLFGAAAGLGPHHARSARFDPGALRLAWTDRRVRLAYAGYLGHMWELYAFWAWIGAAAAASFAPRLGRGRAAGGAARRLRGDRARRPALPAGGAARRPDRQGAGGGAGDAGQRRGGTRDGARLRRAGLAGGGAGADLGRGGHPQLGAVLRAGGRRRAGQPAGSLLALQTALGFTLTFFTVQAVPLVADALGWRSDACAPCARSRRGHRGDAPADAPDGARQRPNRYSHGRIEGARAARRP